MSQKRSLELLASRADGRLRLASPEVGWFTCCLPRESLVAPGAEAGTILTLGVARRLAVPPGVTGRVVSERPERVHAPVGYGDVLYELASLETAVDAQVEAATEEAGSDVPVFRAPHSGRFWHRPSPADPTFVQAGDALEPGTILGLVEVMKTFTHVTYQPAASRRGPELPARAKLVRWLVDDGDEVTEGEPLAEVEPA